MLSLIISMTLPNFLLSKTNWMDSILFSQTEIRNNKWLLLKRPLYGMETILHTKNNSIIIH